MTSRFPLFALLLLMHCAVLPAAESTWTGNGLGHPEWSFGSNWSGGVPAANSALVFPSSASQKSNTNDLALTTLGPISINGTGYQIGGSQIALQGGLNLTSSAATATWSIPMVLDSTQVFSVNTSSTLTLSGALSGAGGFTKSGAGILVLIGNPTCSGPVTISGGTLEVRGIVTQPIQVGNGYVAGAGTVGGIQTLSLPHAGISPGNGGSTAIGTLTSNGNVTLGSTDSVLLNLGSNVTDKVIVNGTCNFGNAVFTFTHLAGPLGLTLNADYTIVENDGTDMVQFGTTMGTWLVLGLGTIDGQLYQLSRVDGTGNDVTIRRVPNTITSTDLDVTPSTPTSVGAPVTLTAHVLVTSGPAVGIPNGTVSFYDGFTKLGEIAVDGTGYATLPVTNLVPGAHNLTAVYNGNGSGTRARSQSAVVSHSVTGTATTTDLSLANAGGTAVTLTADVDATAGVPTGSISFTQNGVVLATLPLDGAGVASYTTAALNVGSYTFAAVYPSTAGFGGSSDSLSHTVTGTATSTTLITSAASVTVGTSVKFTATVSGAPAGTVRFFDGLATIGDAAVSGGTGKAELTTSGLAAGTHSITASYLGSPTHGSSSSSAVTQTITAAPGGGGSGGGKPEEGGGCGLGSGLATLALGLFLLLGLRLRRE